MKHGTKLNIECLLEYLKEQKQNGINKKEKSAIVSVLSQNVNFKIKGL